MAAGERFYAVRQQTNRTVIGSRIMTRAEAAREVSVWCADIGPAAVVPAGRDARRAVRRRDRETLAALLAAYT